MKALMIFRDRVTYGQRCLAALQSRGLEVVIVDHGSTWPPAVEWLKSLDVGVIRRSGGRHPRDLWTWDGLPDVVESERFIVTDPDTVPSDCCPDDWVERL